MSGSFGKEPAKTFQQAEEASKLEKRSLTERELVQEKKQQKYLLQTTRQSFFTTEVASDSED